MFENFTHVWNTQHLKMLFSDVYHQLLVLIFVCCTHKHTADRCNQYWIFINYAGVPVNRL